MILQLKIIGILLQLLALIHIIFPKYFNWKVQLQSLSLINKQLMIVHTFFVALTVFLMGLLCLIAAKELCETHLGKIVLYGLGLFWLIRLFVQLFVYSAKLWKGKKFETFIHILFTALWLYLSSVFLYIAILV
jgi:hypothetical protein